MAKYLKYKLRMPSITSLFFIFMMMVSSSSTFLNETMPELINKEEKQSVKIKNIITHHRFTTDYEEEKVPFGLEGFCHLHDAHLSIQTVAEIKEEHIKRKYQFLHHKKKQILYKLTTSSISAYRFHSNNNTLIKQNQIQLKGTCQKSMIFDLNQHYLYVFSCDGIQSVEVKNILLNLTKIINFSQQFTAFKLFSIDDLILEISPTQGIRIYGIQTNHNLSFIGKVLKYQNKQLNISDALYNEGKLYILDKKQGIFVYNRSTPNSFTELAEIQLNISKELTYHELKNVNNNFYVSASLGSSAFVCQFQLQNGIYYLIRYFKGYSFITQIKIIHRRLMIVADTGIDVFEINLDPRVMSPASNAYSNNHIDYILRTFNISCTKHIIITDKSIDIVQFQVNTQKMECQFPIPNTYSFKKKTKCIEPKNRRQFNINCTKYETVILNVSQQHKDSLIWMLFLIIGLSILIVLVMIFWRQAKVKVIDKLSLQIIKLKQSNAKTVQFVQSNNGNELQNKQHQWQVFHDDADTNEQKIEEIVSERSCLENK